MSYTIDAGSCCSNEVLKALLDGLNNVDLHAHVHVHLNFSQIG